MKIYRVTFALLSAIVFCTCAKSKSPQVAVTFEGTAATAEPISCAASILQPLGLLPLLGRDFLPEDFGKASPGVAIISSELFAGAFGSRPQIMGHIIRVADQDFLIVGVAPPHPTAFEGRKVWLAQQK